jgi:haloalkane dehalogenase
MKVIRTPDERFESLHEYAFAPNYAEVPDLAGGTLRVHYVDEGPKAGRPVVFIHGNPSWSYAWRNVIPPVAAAGYRAISVDLVGLGRSDKPTEMSDYTVARHCEWIRSALIDVLELEDATLVLQDWGGIIGLRTLAAHPSDSRACACRIRGCSCATPRNPSHPKNSSPAAPSRPFRRWCEKRRTGSIGRSCG